MGYLERDVVKGESGVRPLGPSVLDLVADEVFRKVREDRLAVAWQFAMARVIEDRYEEPLRRWLESATRERLLAMVDRMVRCQDWDSSRWIMDYLAGDTA